MSDLRGRAAKLAESDPVLGPKVARVLTATTTLNMMVGMAIKAYAKNILNDVGMRLTNRDRNAKFKKWEDNDWGSTAHFTVPKPGTFIDIPVSITVQGRISDKLGEWQMFVRVGRRGSSWISMAHPVGTMSGHKIADKMDEAILNLLAKE